MPDISLASERETAPQFALVFYGDPSVATVHSVNFDDDTSSIGPGRFLLQSDLSRLGSIFAKASTSSHYLLPERVLGAGSDFLTWYRPGALDLMSFLIDGERHEVSVIWPSLIFHAWGDRLHAVAYLEAGRPGASTPVFSTPLMNFYDSTAMCRGQSVYPDSHDPRTIPQWEYAVYRTLFTHINDTGKLRGRPDTDEAHLAFWKHPSRSKYPVSAKHLVPLSWAPTCGEWLAALHEGDDDE